MLKRKYIIYLVTLLTFTFVSCNGFLDTLPDNRVEWNTPAQISDLLTSGYTDANYATLCELSSDNFIDNQSPDENGVYYNVGSRSRIHDEIFAWEDAVSDDQQDSPSSVWSGCYHAIAVANHALEAIRRFEDEGRGSEVVAQKGEALLIRAYHHFILVNIFAHTYKNEELSKLDLGIPYVTEPEKTVMVHYERLSVTEVYKKIEEDLLEGLDLISDNVYDVPKYHFNKKAAQAFATRFYLFKRNYPKVVEYATYVLGENPAGYLRNWAANYPTFEAYRYGWINAESMNNLLILPTNSTFNRIFGTRYGCSRDGADGTILGEGPSWDNWSYHPCYNGNLYLRGRQEYGVFFPKIGEFFEYTDKIAGIGLPKIVRAEFTGEETLLCRAEAYVYLNDISSAVADLKAYDTSREIPDKPTKELTEALILSFYGKNNPLYVKQYHTEKISPDFIITDTQKPFIDCVLHYRRIETIFDGYRWFDIKRYGIEITHSIGKGRVETLKWDDPRRALQIPQEVIAAGLEPNERLLPRDEGFQTVKANIPCVIVNKNN